MHDVWVYAQSKATIADLSDALAELGFAPHYLGAGEPLMPTGQDGPPRRPSLAAVVAGPGESLPSELFNRISAAEELDDVGLLLVVEPEHLRSYPGLATAYELLVRPFSVAGARGARCTGDAGRRRNGGQFARQGRVARARSRGNIKITIDGQSVGLCLHGVRAVEVPDDAPEPRLPARAKRCWARVGPRLLRRCEDGRRPHPPRPCEARPGAGGADQDGAECRLPVRAAGPGRRCPAYSAAERDGTAGAAVASSQPKRCRRGRRAISSTIASPRPVPPGPRPSLPPAEARRLDPQTLAESHRPRRQHAARRSRSTGARTG